MDLFGGGTNTAQAQTCAPMVTWQEVEEGGRGPMRRYLLSNAFSRVNMFTVHLMKSKSGWSLHIDFSTSQGEGTHIIIPFLLSCWPFENSTDNQSASQSCGFRGRLWEEWLKSDLLSTEGSRTSDLHSPNWRHDDSSMSSFYCRMLTATPMLFSWMMFHPRHLEQNSFSTFFACLLSTT